MKPSEALGRVDKADIVRVVEANTCRNPRVFGSVARGQDEEDSDLDLLVDRTDATDLLNLARLRLDLGELLGVRVDTLVDYRLPPHLKKSVMADARPL